MRVKFTAAIIFSLLNFCFMRKYYLSLVSTTLLFSVLFSSCKKETTSTQSAEEVAALKGTKAKNVKAQGNLIDVSNVVQLYDAVNNPANAGKVIVLAPGTYTLNTSYPNSGRLELQADMSLQGQPGHAEDVIIDESLLPVTSFAIPSGRTGGVRLGVGTHTIEWLTLKGSAAGLSVIDTDLSSTETHINISHIIIYGNGSSIGIDIRNRISGRIIEAELENNDISGNTTLLGPAIEVQNANPASGAIIKVDMKENYLHGNKVGLGGFNNGGQASVSNNRIEINSHADRIEGNGVGMYFGGATSQVATALATNNTTIVNAHGTKIQYNNPVPLPALLKPDVPGFIPTGIYAFGGRSSSAQGYNKSSNNTLKINFWGCKISDNNSPDITAIGAWCQPQAILAGTNNLVEIHLNGVSKKARVDAIASSPTEPAGTNVVNIFRN